jgi:hypothetical protein
MMPEDWEAIRCARAIGAASQDAQTYMPLQVTEEEFKANMERDRFARIGKRNSHVGGFTDAGRACVEDAAAARAHGRECGIGGRGPRVTKSLKQGGSVLVFGNGGSAADAQHFAAGWLAATRRIARPGRPSR